MTFEIGKKKEVKMMRTFATPAYLQEEEKGVFMLYRNVEVEDKDLRTGKVTREKVKAICVSPKPLREFRPDKDDPQQVVLESYHPTENRPLKLVEID